MPKASSYPGIATQYPDLGDVPASSEFVVAIEGVGNFTVTPPQLAVILGGAPTLDFTEIVEGINEELGQDDWQQGGDGVGGGTLDNIVEDISPQLGGNLDLNGFTVGAATAADLTKLHALTATSTELNYVAGVTSAIQTQLNAKQATITDADQADFTKLSELTATSTELNYVDGVTSAIQTQIDAFGDTTGAALVGVDNTLIGGVATDVQAALEYLADEALFQSEAEVVTEVTSYAVGDKAVIELAGGGFRTIQLQFLLGGAPSVRSFTGTSDTLAITDFGGRVISRGSATATVTIPAYATVPFPPNAEVEIVRLGSGDVDVVGASGVVVNGALTGSVALGDRYSSLRLIHTDVLNEWVAVGAPAGTVTDAVAPIVSTLSPANGASGVLTSTTMVATFSEDIAFGTGNITLRDNDGGWADLEAFDVATEVGTTAGTVNIVGNQLFIRPTTAMANGIPHAIQIAATCIDDLAGNSYAGITDDTTWTWTIVESAPSGPTLVTSQAQAVATGTTAAAIGLPTLAEGDKVFLFCAVDGAHAGVPTGYTAIYDRTTSNNPGGYVCWKVMGAVPDTSISIPRVSNRKLAIVIAVLRGANAASIDGFATAATAATGSPDAPAYAQVNANAFRFAFGFLDDDEVTMSAPAGWTLLRAVTTNGAGADLGASVVVAYQAAGGSASTSVNPAVFGGSADDEWYAGHFAQH